MIALFIVNYHMIFQINPSHKIIAQLIKCENTWKHVKCGTHIVEAEQLKHGWLFRAPTQVGNLGNSLEFDLG